MTRRASSQLLPSFGLALSSAPRTSQHVRAAATSAAPSALCLGIASHSSAAAARWAVAMLAWSHPAPCRTDLPSVIAPRTSSCVAARLSATSCHAAPTSSSPDIALEPASERSSSDTSPAQVAALAQSDTRSASRSCTTKAACAASALPASLVRGKAHSSASAAVSAVVAMSEWSQGGAGAAAPERTDLPEASVCETAPSVCSRLSPNSRIWRRDGRGGGGGATRVGSGMPV